MNEFEIIEGIKKVSQSPYIDDDCAFLDTEKIVVTQDNLVENVHFSLDWCNFYQLGYKSAIVNISDVLASGAKPAYITLGLSVTNHQSNDDIYNFMKGFNDVCRAYDVKIIGGDTTLSKSGVFISVTAIGTTTGRRISSRKNAKPGYVVVTSGEHGLSAAGLKELVKDKNARTKYTDALLMPKIDADFSELISKNIDCDYSMMDTSDGLADALFKIAQLSNATVICNYDSIPHYNDISKEDVLFGGEDYKLVAAVPKEFAQKHGLTVIGYVVKQDNDTILKIDNDEYKSYNELNVFKHFGD